MSEMGSKGSYQHFWGSSESHTARWCSLLDNELGPGAGLPEVRRQSLPVKSFRQNYLRRNRRKRQLEESLPYPQVS